MSDLSRCHPDARRTVGRRGFVLSAVFGLLLGAFSLALPVFAAAEAVPTDLGDRVHDRYRVWVEDDEIRLRPKGGDSAVRSITLSDDDEEAEVNGKAFSADELRAFLGKDGELVADLLALDAEGRRRALGHSAEETGEDSESSGVPAPPPAPGAPPVPPVPGAHIQIESDGDDRVSFGRSIVVEAGESTGDAVCIGCSITVRGQVEGDAVAVGGSVRLEDEALVSGNAVSVGGSVRLASTSTVDGDAVVIGGSVQAEEGATIGGQRSSVGWGGGWGRHRDEDSDWDWPFLFDTGFSDLFWSLLRALFLALLCAISVMFARGSMERTSRRLVEEPWKAIFAGLLTQLLFFPVLLFVTVILAVSIVGIPLLVLVPVAVFALFVATLIGFAAVAQSLGRWAGERFGWQLTEPYVPVLLGVALIQGVTILGRIVGVPGSFFGLAALSFVAFGFFIKYAAWTMGLGAMTLSLLGRDWRRRTPEPPRGRRTYTTEPDDAAIPEAPVVPPVPQAPSAPAAPEGTAGSERAEATILEADGSGSEPSLDAPGEVREGDLGTEKRP